MPNYFYVNDSGTRGTADTPYTTLQTGTFPSSANCYANLDEVWDVATNPPVGGDYILVADTHSASLGVNITISAPDVLGAPVYIISVDATACDTYKRGATTTSTSGFDITFDGWMVVMGCDFVCGDDIAATIGATTSFHDCEFTVNTSSARPLAVSSDQSVQFHHCTWHYENSSSNPIFFGGHCETDFWNCTFTTASGFTDEPLAGNASDGYSANFYGCDFSGISSTALISGGDWDDIGNVAKNYTFERCKFPTTLTSFVTNSPAHPGQWIRITNSSDSTTDNAEYQFYFESGLGVVEENTAVYRDASQPFPSGQKASLKIVTDANASAGKPFTFELPTRYAKLSDTASDTIRAHFTCTNSLDNGDVWLEVVYPDGTNTYTPNFGESVTDGFNPLRTAGSLSTDTGSWTGGLTNKYYIDIDTSTDAGGDCHPIVLVYVAKASETIYFDSEVEIRG